MPLLLPLSKAIDEVRRVGDNGCLLQFFDDVIIC